MADIESRLDARGLKCPLPVLKARRAISSLQSGDRLEVLTTDPGAPQDFKAFAEFGQHVIESEETLADGSWRMVLIKG